jgi:predicted house-cleaning NTP pyrophosphatase (Maf/HAM1 superfamily)
MFGMYSGTSFLQTDNYGFRAIGVASGLSEREQAFRVAVSQIMVNASSAQVKARTALSANGNTLASIAIKKAMVGDTATYTSAEIGAVGSMITGIKEALAAVEAAYLELIYATIYSSELGLEDLVATAAANAAKAAAEAETSGNLGAKIAAVVAAAAEQGAELDTADLPTYTKFEEAVAKFTTAQTKHGLISGKEECTWSELSAALYPLVDIDKIKINDYTPTEVKDNTGAIASQVIAGKGINVVIPSEGGVFADIADYAGDYTVAIQINTADLKLGVDAGVVDATMKADSTLTTSIFAGAKTAINNKKPSGESADKPLTEFYGYAIDLAFRTNASTSNLLLQTAAADRIYAGNQNEETMGEGSSMTFATTDATFTKDKMLNLMSKFEVVFYDTDSEDILGYAKLDTNADNVTGTAADGITANLLMLDAEGNFITEAKDAVITDLDPNVAQHVTVLVYLDGETIENKDVAASAMQSMSGTFNIQFASSAELQPMEYSDLHTPAPKAD